MAGTSPGGRDPALTERLGAATLETARGLTWDIRAVRIRDFLAQRLAAIRG